MRVKAGMEGGRMGPIPQPDKGRGEGDDVGNPHSENLRNLKENPLPGIQE